MNKTLKSILTGVLILVASVIAGLLLITAVYCLPVSRIRSNVASSSAVIDEEGLTTYRVPWLLTTRRDNYTDTIMLSMAAYDGSESAINEAMTSRYVYVIDEDLYFQPGYLLRMLDASNDGSSAVVSYSRYWHGYLVLIKPLLMVLDITGIRLLNAVVQVIMLGFILLRMVHHPKAKMFVFPLLVTVYALNPVSTFMNMQFACIYNITLLSLLLMFNTRLFSREHYWKAFMVIGICVAYCDFLTYPLVSLGLPLIMMIAISDNDSRTNLKMAAVSCINWGIGYAFMWASKWILCDVITGSSTIADALNQARERTVTDAYAATGIKSDNIIDVIGYNVEAFRDWLSFGVFVGAVVAFVVYLLVSKRKIKLCENTLIVLLLIALTPFVWYVVLSNHSAIHAYMTYRDLAVSIMAAGVILMGSVVKTDASRRL